SSGHLVSCKQSTSGCALFRNRATRSMRSRTELMFQVVTLKDIAQIYDADDGFSNAMAGIVATIHVLFLRRYTWVRGARPCLPPCAVRNISCGSAYSRS